MRKYGSSIKYPIRSSAGPEKFRTHIFLQKYTYNMQEYLLSILDTPSNDTNSTNVDPVPNGASLLTAKIVILFCLLVSSLLSCLLPLVIGRWSYIHRRISVNKIMVFFDLSQGFGGGILLGAGLLHLMAEA
jgi:hypothetical protein